MAQFRPFKGIRPKPELAEKVASLPYDVMNRAEAKKMAEGNKYSFLHVARAEIDLNDSVDEHSGEVYQGAARNLERMLKEGTLMRDNAPRFYIYRQVMDNRLQTGIVGCTSIDDYMRGNIRKHELTRVEKEIDRINNFDSCNAHTEPVFLTYRKSGRINALVDNWIEKNKPVYDFTSNDNIRHSVWVIDDANTIETIEETFAAMECLYIADGHHRSASSVKVGMRRRESALNYTGKEEFNYFLAVVFPDEDLYIMDYNRVVKDLNGNTPDLFLSRIGEKFDVEKVEGQFKPNEKHTFGMYMENSWYKLTAREGSFDRENAIERLDVSILQNNLLKPVLGIEDPRTDNRIDFVGGIRGLKELERKVSAGMAVAFSMFPTTIDDLILVADSGLIMPPKSTWFEPKLRSGLFIHSFF